MCEFKSKGYTIKTKFPDMYGFLFILRLITYFQKNKFIKSLKSISHAYLKPLTNSIIQNLAIITEFNY